MLFSRSKQKVLSLPGSLLFATLVPLCAQAADTLCGVDTDFNETYDAACAAPDVDGDCYTTDGTLCGNDCDDTLAGAGGLDGRFIYPGIWIDAGSGNVKKCKTDGTYDTPVALSSYQPDGVAVDIWVAATGTGSTSVGCGAFGNPCDYLCLANTGAACYITPANKSIVFRGGNYTGTWNGGNRQLYVIGKAGTKFHCAPGELCTIVGQAVSPTSFNPVYLEEGDDGIFEGFEIKNGYATVGLKFGGAVDRWVVKNNVIHDIDGAQSNNVAGTSYGGTGSSFHHNVWYDNYDRANNVGADENNSCFVGFGGQNNDVTDNTCGYTTKTIGSGLKWKHGDSTGGLRYKRNVVFNATGAAFLSNTASTVVEANLAYNSDFCFDVHDFGGTPYCTGMQFNYNTCINGAGIQFTVDQCTGGNGDMVAHHNVFVDNQSGSYASDGTDGLHRINHYGSTALCATMATTSKFNLHDNCYFQTNSLTIPFDFFGNNGTALCKIYNGLAAWKAAYANSDLNSFNEDPGNTAPTHTAISTNCLDKGRPQNTTTTSTATTTSSTTSTLAAGTVNGFIPGSLGSLQNNLKKLWEALV